jgi:hypothetical protein
LQRHVLGGFRTAPTIHRYSSLKHDEMINYWRTSISSVRLFGPLRFYSVSRHKIALQGSSMKKRNGLSDPKSFSPKAFALPCLAVIAFTLASSCASTQSADAPPSENGAQSSSEQMQGAASNAARQPLRDIGLMKKKIPYALSRIADPYAEPSGPGCVWITYELTQLSAALGPEVAVMPVASRASARERGSRMAMETARDMIASAGSRLLPGRSVIRTLSGASNAEELYEAAQQRGMVRRGYLKGLSEARDCKA